MDTTQKNREADTPPKSRPVHREGSPADAQRTAKSQTKEETFRPRKKPAEKKSTGKTVPLKKKAPARKKQDPGKGQRPPKKPDPEDIGAKKRSYGNSKPRKNAVTAVGDAIQKTAKKNTEKKKKKSNRPKQPTPAVIYTQPQAFNRNRLLVQLVTITAVVAAVVMSLAVFFKVEHITISGAEVYDPYVIEKASGIQKKTTTEPGDNLLTFSRPRAGALIKANLPYVDTVRFGIKLPGTVNIIIEEDDVVYAIKDQNEAWWLINSDGRVVEAGTGSKAANHTQVLGVQLESPVPDTIGIAVETVSTETYPEGDPNAGQPVPVTQTNAQRLAAALQILQALEANDIVGSAASVDVSRLEDIILWYGTRYQVNLGDTANLEYKITCMNDVILQMSDYQSGILDISFTIWPDQVGYTPFA
ncbi:MAG: FtsQ-type POTRA domain-containing protein [Oscillospiraceae bacterium]|nr:FtsQ-type POTRA domain-containing protein [Oscillospiraceae bacterium]